jgi:Kef-type K+ transport system membrane component KefB
LTAGLILTIAVALAYLAAHGAFDWLARRFLIVSGAEYLILGLLLGPYGAGVLSVEMLDGFAPLTTLALGWIGAIVGFQFFLPGLVRIPALLYRLAFAEALTTFAVVTGATATLARWSFALPWRDAFVPGVALGAIAAVSAPAGIEVVARRLGERGPIVRQLQLATAVDALIGILAMGLLLGIRAPDHVAAGARALTETEWVVVTLAIGVVGGTLFHLFLGAERDADRLFVSIAGALVLTTGAAAYLHLSPLLSAMVMGMVLVNTSRARHEIAAVLHSAERPFYFVLLIFAGATWQPSLRAWQIPVLVFLAARVLGKVGGAAWATYASEAREALGVHWGRALLGQGGLALALALDYQAQDWAIVPHIVFTAAIVSVLLTDVVAARLIHSVVAPLVRGRDGEPAAAPTPPPPPAAEARP